MQPTFSFLPPRLTLQGRHKTSHPPARQGFFSSSHRLQQLTRCSWGAEATGKALSRFITRKRWAPSPKYSFLELTSPLQVESNPANAWKQQAYNELRLWSTLITSLIAFTFFFACGCLALLITARESAARPSLAPLPPPILPAFLTSETVTDLSARITT